VDWLYSIHDEDDESQMSVINYPHEKQKLGHAKQQPLKTR